MWLLINLRIVGSDMITIIYVFGVKTSINAVKFEFFTSIDWNSVCDLLNYITYNIIIKIILW